jgi:hypothetical protein
MRTKKATGYDCNVSDCPGMAHPCTRLSYQQAKWKFEHGERGLAITEAFRLECVQYEHEIQELKDEIQELKDELLATYRRVRS